MKGVTHSNMYLALTDMFYVIKQDVKNISLACVIHWSQFRPLTKNPFKLETIVRTHQYQRPSTCRVPTQYSLLFTILLPSTLSHCVYAEKISPQTVRHIKTSQNSNRFCGGSHNNGCLWDQILPWSLTDTHRDLRKHHQQMLKKRLSQWRGN